MTRAVQLAALTLYMRALELLRDEARARRKPMPRWTPPQINLATTPGMALTPVAAATPPLPAQRERGPGGEGSLERHLQRHPADRPLRPVLERIFETLAQAEILGSLLRPGAEIDAAIAKVQAPRTRDMFAANDGTDAIAQHDPSELKRLILDRIATAFRAEAASADPADALFGREAERGVRLLQLLDRKYAVVVTNPPYMGSSNMGAPLKAYVERNYKPGKRDLYAAFILRCLDLCLQDGRVAMVTQQSWMFLKSYSDLRAISTEKLAYAQRHGEFTGLLREIKLDVVAHLGEFAFEDASAAGAFAAMFVIINNKPEDNYRMMGLRVVAPKTVEGKKALLLDASNNSIRYTQQQAVFLAVDGSPIVYWLSDEFVDMLRRERKVGQAAYVRQGICTTDNVRFLRNVWEAPVVTIDSRWVLFAKGGGIKRWSGLDQYVVDWAYDGRRIKNYQDDTPGAIHWSGRMPASNYFFQSGWTFTRVARGTLAVREIPRKSLFGHTAPAAIPFDQSDWHVVGFWLNTRVSTYLLRTLTQNLNCQEGYVQKLPLPTTLTASRARELNAFPIAFRNLVNSIDSTEEAFSVRPLHELCDGDIRLRLQAIYVSIEGVRERIAVEEARLSPSDISILFSELGTPAGFHPLLAGYDALPELPAELELPELPREVIDYLAQHQRLSPSPSELARIKARLRGLYEAGYGAKDDGADDASDAEGDADDEEAAVAGAHIPIPTETFLEELSVRMELHPISVYWLLEELRAAGVRCKPEERRLLEDRLSVLALRLLGHRWPAELKIENEQLKKDGTAAAHAPFSILNAQLPEWVDKDGIIPLVNLGTGETTLAERLRERLRAEDDNIGAQRAEALLSELTGATSLEDWLARIFWPRHVRQFKSRPIAWHLLSRPVGAGKGRGTRRAPLFECMIYYHATGGDPATGSGYDALARLRTQYVEPLLRREESALNEALGKDNTDAAASATLRVQELREFLARIQQVERAGFACAELDALLANEPLDRWSGDGIVPPAGHDDLARQERAWRVDLNDGVRVNIAPLQLAGLLPGEVLRAADAKKAIADRARWRSDERRWVREGKLPRPGWLPASVPESPEWTRKQPERAAEQAKLEEKRRVATKELAGD